MKKDVIYIAIKMDVKEGSPIVDMYESLSEAIKDIQNFDDEYKKNIVIDHWEDGLSVRVLKFNEESGEFESHFDDTYIPELEDEDELNYE